MYLLFLTEHEYILAEWEWRSDCCNTNSTIFQLYHGNKLIFNEMMMMSALY